MLSRPWPVASPRQFNEINPRFMMQRHFAHFDHALTPRVPARTADRTEYRQHQYAKRHLARACCRSLARGWRAGGHCLQRRDVQALRSSRTGQAVTLAESTSPGTGHSRRTGRPRWLVQCGPAAAGAPCCRLHSSRVPHLRGTARPYFCNTLVRNINTHIHAGRPGHQSSRHGLSPQPRHKHQRGGLARAHPGAAHQFQDQLRPGGAAT